MKLRLGMAFLCLVFCTGFSLSFETSWKDVKKSVLKKNTKKAISQIKKIKAKEPMLGLKHFALGYLLFEDGNYGESQWHLKQYFFYDEMMSSYAHYYLGAIAFKNKKFSESQKYFQQALKQKIHRFLKRDVELSLAKVYMKMKKYSSARLSLRKLEKKWRRTDLYPDILQELVLVEYHRKRKSKACHWLQKIYRDYPYKEEVKVSDGTLQMENLNLKCLVTLGDQKKRIRSLQWAGRFAQAQKEIDSLRKKPSSFTDYELDFLQAYHWTYEGHPDKALNLLKKYQKNKWSHWEYLTFLGKVAVKLQDAELSLKAFHRAYEIAKSRKRKKEALYDVAFIAYQFKRYDMASKKFLSFYKKYPMRESTKVNVLWYVAWTHFLNNKFKESISYFDKLLSIYKKSRKDYSFQEERASYWKSLAHVEMEQYDKAQELLMRISQNSLMTYYSFLSYYRLRNISHKVPLKISLMKGSSVSDFINYQEEIKSVMRSLSSLDEINNIQYEKSLFESETKPSGNPENDESVEESFLSFNNFKRKNFKKNKIFLERGKILKSLGFYKQARYEFYEVEFNTSDLSLLRLLMENYEEIESFHRSAYIAEVYFSKARRQYGLEGSRKLWSYAYPKVYEKDISKNSRYFLLPKEILWSIIRAETFYRVDAVSPVGARGLMQLMTPTGKKVAQLSKIEFSKEKLFEPSFNIRLGAHYVHRLRKKFKKKLVLLIGSYNAGPHNVESWVYRFGDLPVDSFIEHIPYLETRNYIKKVVRYYGIYNLLYGDSSFEMDWLIKPLGFSVRQPATKESWEPL